MAVLDTSFLIAVERGDARADRLLASLREAGDPLRVPAAAWIEYLSGMAPTVRAKAERTLEAAASFEPLTREIATEAARLQHALAASGSRLGWHDLQIAATAMHLGDHLVSADGSFADVPGLDVLVP